jgi:hypothetical protein
MSTNGFPMPKNVFKGRNSDGSTFRMEEWDFKDLATLELIPTIFMCLFACAAASLAAPVLTTLLLLFVGINGRFRYLFTAALSAYVLYDFAHGWLSLLGTSFFFSDKHVSYIMYANMIALTLSLFMFLFHHWLNGFVFESVSGYSDADYYKLPTASREIHDAKIQKQMEKVLYMVLIIGAITLFAGILINEANEGWVEKNTRSSESEIAMRTHLASSAPHT